MTDQPYTHWMVTMYGGPADGQTVKVKAGTRELHWIVPTEYPTYPAVSPGWESPVKPFHRYEIVNRWQAEYRGVV